MKITDMLLNYVLKNGLIGESQNCEAVIDIPESNTKVTLKAEKLTVRIEQTKKEA